MPPPPAPRILVPGRRRDISPPGGFTLLELLVVMILLGVVLMAALPRFAGTGEAYLKTDASRVSSFVRFINDASATRKAYYRVSFDISAGEIRAERSPDGVHYAQETDPVARRLRLREGVVMEDIVVPELGTVNTGTVMVVFTPAGAQEPFTLHLSSSKKQITLTFNPYSGEVSMEDGYVRS
ncbi:MAG: prepilin-type N-terminal cleavage/methylation domain-containing protein [Deltaproteobacteria bacterium]|nr:prepilin-type N-terminal cleavage/methylation domain-containing protein [Deltaproteobacteria bacterium]